MVGMWHEQVAVHSGYSVKKKLIEKRIGKILKKKFLTLNFVEIQLVGGGSQVAPCGQTNTAVVSQLQTHVEYQEYFLG